MQPRTKRVRPRRGRGDDGAAMVEFAFVMVLLFMLIFGIITFGLLLSFKQDMTRAAAEGARAGAVAVPGDARDDAEAATEEAVKAFGGSFTTAGCLRTGMNCNISPAIPCPEDVNLRCITVKLVFQYEANPLFGSVPLISQFLPETVEATSVARVNQ